MAGSVSRQRVRARVKEIAARILQSELKDPRMGFVTVTDCVLSHDYRHATIKVSILAEREGEVRKILRMLDDARGFVQRGVAHGLRTRVTPELRFELDQGAEQSVRIGGLLDQLKAEREAREGGQVPPPVEVPPRPAAADEAEDPDEAAYAETAAEWDDEDDEDEDDDDDDGDDDDDE